jgi:hypothetical protein
MSSKLNNQSGDIKRAAQPSACRRNQCDSRDAIKQIEDSLENDIKPAVQLLVKSSTSIHWDDNLAEWLDRKLIELRQSSVLAEQAAKKTKAALLKKWH